MMNKKGGTIFGTNFVVAIFLGIVFFIFFAGGGAVTIFKITQFLKTIPTPVWIFFGVILVLRILGGRK